MGCPSNKKTCGLGETVEKTTKDVLDELIKNIPSGAKIKSEKILKNLNVNAFNYEIIDENGLSEDIYLFRTEKEVIKISFNRYDSLKTGFIDDFLEKIKNDKL